jgi:hypothetical protein
MQPDAAKPALLMRGVRQQGMDPRSLIEGHQTLIADGWDIQVEMTDRSKNGKVTRYLLSKPKSETSNLKITLTYPIISESGKYELVSKNENKIIANEFYASETDAQSALLNFSRFDAEKTNDTAS